MTATTIHKMTRQQLVNYLTTALQCNDFAGVTIAELRDQVREHNGLEPKYFY